MYMARSMTLVRSADILALNVSDVRLPALACSPSAASTLHHLHRKVTFKLDSMDRVCSKQE